ncbi:MAG TPA: HEAT repeat domain-containing protein [Urbifossiella sp.]|nr:HEAT repeat domain-containing protein [Urbifossiella sp.]
MTQPSQSRWAVRWPVVAAVGGLIAVGVAVVVYFLSSTESQPGGSADGSERDPRQLLAARHITLWWDLPARFAGDPQSNPHSNIHPSDYAGPASCQQCHPGNYEAWSHHPHRWMNALANAETVRGDFSETASINYRGGKASFRRADGGFAMILERDGVRRTYRITQTIGSRFYQYYVGRQTEGPEPPSHHFYHKDHVLPFGYWLSANEWVPTVHIGPELPDDKRPDPYSPADHGSYYAEYAVSCNACHTTFALGDMLGRRPQQMGEHAPASLHWALHEYTKSARPAELAKMERAHTMNIGQNPMAGWDAEHYAMTFGVSCEACHLGSREHVASGGAIRPRFFPTSPNLAVAGKAPDPGRTVENINWACGRCHTGGRPSFAAGMSTWNSVEYADAARGSCYSKMRCIDCHSPHAALGTQWTRTPDQDDAVCLKCHDQFRAADKRSAHTHHAPGSSGDRCLNCHMPRINEGLQDVVRTHMIFSPTRPDMIEANHPNACNLCHTDKAIDWTLDKLKAWYGKTYDGAKIAGHYKDRARPVARGWLRSENESVRLVAADALARTRDPRVVPELLDALDDPFLLNRQFAARDLQQMLGVRPADEGYRFFMTREERKEPLAALRTKHGPK